VSSLTDQNESDPFGGVLGASDLEPAGVHSLSHFSLGDGPVGPEPRAGMPPRQEESFEEARSEATPKESFPSGICQNCGAPAEPHSNSEWPATKVGSHFALLRSGQMQRSSDKILFCLGEGMRCAKTKLSHQKE